VRALPLRRALRGDQARMVRDVVTMLPCSVCVIDVQGKVLLGDESTTGSRVDIVHGKTVIGHVTAAERAGEVARVIQWVYEREVEKRNLAAETLERYKELSLLYDLGEKLSRQLEIDDVARAVLTDAQRYLGASGAALYLLDGQGESLELSAYVGDHEVAAVIPAAAGVEGRVLATGRAMFVAADNLANDFVELGDKTAIICAPLRVGERVFGVLRLWQAEATWTAGDLKLVAALAANASSAVSAAQLHARRVRELSLLSQLERHVSPSLFEACVGPEALEADHPLVVACCDPRSLVATNHSEDSKTLADTVEAGAAIVMSAFLDGGAVVDTPQGIVLGIFTGPQSREQALTAGRAVLSNLRGAASSAVIPGIGVASTRLGDAGPDRMYACINAAAMLQTDIVGKLVAEEGIACVLPEQERLPIGEYELPIGTKTVFEVTP
jgi:putative methionine-R-sulfoxide reductase with GAF domain